MQHSDAIMERFLALHPRKIDLSLGRLETLLAHLGNPHLHLPPTLHVAGTNGKGSTIAFARALLEAMGHKVHVYTSPHLVRFHERIRLAGTLVDEERLVDALNLCERVNDGAPITLFEMITAAAFVLFHATPADVLLLEVGLGGRFDATNVIKAPRASVITPISYDHMEFLGTKITQIAYEKAGILKPAIPAFIGAQDDEALDEITRVAHEVNAPLSIYGQDFTAYSEHGRFVFQDERGLLDLPLPALAGVHQFDNAALALAAVRGVFPDISESACTQAMGDVTWAGRMQHLARGPLVALAPDGADVWLDGGHNEAGGHVLAQALAALNERAPRPLVLICGSLTTKDTAAFLRPLLALSDHLIAIPIHGEHAGRTPAEITAMARAMNFAHAHECSDLRDAMTFSRTLCGQRSPRLMIAGSLYLAGEALRLNEEFPT
jgi:dihydrofolate synthase / folylpolyglutamate synthase